MCLCNIASHGDNLLKIPLPPSLLTKAWPNRQVWPFSYCCTDDFGPPWFVKSAAQQPETR